jgi:hypothetical protein
MRVYKELPVLPPSYIDKILRFGFEHIPTEQELKAFASSEIVRTDPCQAFLDSHLGTTQKAGN